MGFLSVGRCWWLWHFGMIITWKKLVAVFVFLILPVLLLTVIVKYESIDKNDVTSEFQSKLTDEEVRSLVRRLRSVTTDNGPEASKARSDFLRARYPWVIREHTLPNYVLNDERIQSVANPNGDLLRIRYVNGIKVFVHFPRSSGMSIVKCLRWMTNGTSSFVAPLAIEEFRLLWDSSLNERYRNRFDFYAGGHSFGICDSIYQRPCSYFTVFRDPIRQAVSSYYHCRESLADPQCTVINANQVSLRDWVILQGGSLFSKFLYNSSVCRSNLSKYIETNDVDIRKVIMNLETVSCWFKHKLYINTFPEEEKKILLDYVLDNLERFFAVIGIFEDMERTLKVLEYVYGLPFSECSKFLSKTADDSFAEMRVGVNSADFNALDSEQSERLWNDPVVRNALKDDYKIYERAKDIFAQQNQRLFNWLKR